MRALITGGDGFVGKHLVELLNKLGHATFVFDMRRGDDIRDYEQIRRAVEGLEPDWIFHLAAQADVPEGLLDPWRALDVNTMGTFNLLEACRNTASRARIHLAGSSAEYGSSPPQQAFVDEDTVAAPTEPYAVSKLAATTLGMVYATKYGLPVIATRAFNHTGPGRPSRYVDAAFARRIVAIEREQLDVLSHGHLDAVRNFTDVRDVVRAYIDLLECAPSGIYNVCSDNNISIAEVLHMLVAHAKVPVRTYLDPSFGRPTQGEVFFAPTAKKLEQAIAWSPGISLEQTFADLLDWWRER